MPDTLDEFINQKRQMFRVELSKETLQKEINNLDKKTERRLQALGQSGLELETDRRDLMSFVEKSNNDRKEKEFEEKRLLREKKLKEDKETALNIEIQQYNSEIEKNRDACTYLNELKGFILELSDQDFLAQLNKQKEAERLRFK